MTDTTETPVEDAPVETAEVESQEAPDFAAEVEKWKALARKNEARAKENADKAKRFDEIEEASKSELEKAQARLADLEREATEARADKLRSDVARTKGVPIELLTASDEESLNAQADALLAFKGNPPSAPSSDGQGKTGEPVSAGVKQLTRDDFNRLSPEEKLAARDKGQLVDLLREGA